MSKFVLMLGVHCNSTSGHVMLVISILFSFVIFVLIFLYKIHLICTIEHQHVWLYAFTAFRGFCPENWCPETLRVSKKFEMSSQPETADEVET